MFSINLGKGWHGIENSILALKKNKADVRFADDGIAARIPLLLVNRVEVISNDKIGVRPDIASGSAAIVLGANYVSKTGIAIFIDLQRRGFDSIQSFVEADPRADGQPGLFLHRFHGILHGKQLKEIDCGYDDRHKQSSYGYFSRLQTTNPSAERWHVDFLWLGAQSLFWMSLSYGSARLIVCYGGGRPFLVLLALALLFVFAFQFVRSLIAFRNRSTESVTQKDLTHSILCNTVSGMANVLSAEKQTAIIAALAEGSSIRSIERITGVHRDTIMRLGVKVGQGCTALLDEKMRNLPCRLLQLDEIWGFIGKKERHVRPDDDPQYGNVWTFCAIDAETKLVPSFKCGKRDLATAKTVRCGRTEPDDQPGADFRRCAEGLR